jgi:hypothetical protein
MNNKNFAVLEKMLDEIAIARSLMRGSDLASFLQDEMLKRAACIDGCQWWRTGQES